MSAIRAAAAPFTLAFGSGATTGSITSNAWTPGRDSRGVVNAVSWALVPSGQWTSVVGSSINNLDAVVKARMPWHDYGNGNTDWDATVIVWNGCAKDEANARMWFHGGGHADSSNNGIYRWDGFKFAWDIECMPSDTTPWSSGYKAHNSGSTFSICDESETAAKAKFDATTLSATNDVAYDELLWDKKPAARHVYNGLVYCPDRGEIAMAVRRLWTYSLGAGKWNYKRLYNDELTSALTAADSGTNRLGEGSFAVYDETTGEVLMSAYGSSGVAEKAAFNLRVKTWDTGWSAPADTWAVGALARFGRIVTYVRAPGNGSDGRGEYKRYDLDTRTVTHSGNFTLGSGVGSFDLGAQLPTLMYVPGINRYWFCAATSATDMVWHEIDTTTTPWTMNLKTFTGDVPIPPKFVGGTLSEPGCKHMYIPSMNAMIYFFRGDSAARMYVFKF